MRNVRNALIFFFALKLFCILCFEIDALHKACGILRYLMQKTDILCEHLI